VQQLHYMTSYSDLEARSASCANKMETTTKEREYELIDIWPIGRAGHESTLFDPISAEVAGEAVLNGRFQAGEILGAIKESSQWPCQAWRCLLFLSAAGDLLPRDRWGGLYDN
jgi:hypothetical protein